jgi:tetratricopeptide (TPR) repeat protein/transglutaminase-like putative cysteine protease
MKTCRWIFSAILIALALPLAGAAQQTPASPPKPGSAPQAAKEAAKDAEQKPDASQEAFVIERVFSRARYEADGTGRTETHIRVRVQSEAGVQRLGELTFGYNSANQKLDVDFVRVHKADGTLVTAGPEAVKDLNAAFTREAPMYTDFRQKIITVPGLRPGETLEYKYTTATDPPLAPGNFWLEYNFEKNAIVLDERLEVDVPRSVELKLKTHPGLDPRITEAGGRRTYVWTSTNLQRPSEVEDRKQKKEKPPEGPAIQISSFKSWQEIGRWYAELEKDRVQPTAEVKARAEELLAGKTTPLEKTRAVYDFVARNFRYVSLSFGIGRIQPHAAAEVLSNQYGDCKDKHTLLASLLTAAGLRAEPVLISTGRRLDIDLPSPSQFDHVISRVEAGGETLWMDTTPEVAPFRMLSANLRGKKALLASATRSEIVETPPDPPFNSRQDVTIEGKVSDLGKLSATVRCLMRGDAELLLRLAFRRTPRAQWKQLAQYIANSDGFRGEVSDVMASDPSATSDPFTLEYKVEVPNFLKWASKSSEVDLPMPSIGLPPAGSEDDSEEKIELGSPLDVALRLTLELPEKYKGRAPVAISVSRDYAEYRSSYKLAGRTLTAERIVHFRLRDLPASRRGDYNSFLRAVRNDENQNFHVESTTEGAPVIPSTAKAAELFATGVAALESDDYAAAVELLKRVVELEPEHKWAWNQLGRAYLSLRQFGDAIAAFHKQIGVNPYDEFAYNNLGLAYWRTQRFAEAEKAFRRQIEVNPLDRFAHANLGSLLREQKRYVEAAEVLERAVALSPQNPGLLVSLGQAQLNSGKEAEAMESFDKAIELAPLPPIWNNIAYELSLKKVQLDRAQQYAESAVQQTAAQLRNVRLDKVTMTEMSQVGSIAAYWDTLGWVFFQRGELDEAEQYVRASWLLGQHGEVGDHLGRILEKKGRQAEAIAVLAQAANAERPLAETRDYLRQLIPNETKFNAALEAGRKQLEQTNAIRLDASLEVNAEAEFLLLVGPDGAVEQARFIKGDSSLRAVTDSVARAKVPASVPSKTVARIIRSATLKCTEKGGECILTLRRPDHVTSVN